MSVQTGIDFITQNAMMMAMVSIPEQAVTAFFEPQIPLLQRLSVSLAMFAIHFGVNGFIARVPSIKMELPWILGTALYAYVVLGVKPITAIALVAADSVMTMSMR